jgi:hypothetical protein
MPLFDVICKEHGSHEVLGELTRLRCPVCKGEVTRKWSGGLKVVVNFRSGWDMGEGRNFYSKRERDNYLGKVGARKVS